MSALSKVALVVVGVALAGGLVIGLIEVGTAEVPEDTPPPRASAVATTTTTSSSTTTTTVVTTTTVPPTTTTSLPPREALVIHGTGDVNLDPGYIANLASSGYDYAWAGLEGLFLDDDLTVVNLECAPSDLGSPEPKEFVFRCPSESLPSLAAAGVEVANLGNNHSGDYGKEALVDGLARLRDVGVTPVGAGEDAADAGAPALFDVGGWKIAVLGFGGVVPTPAWLASADRAGMRDGDDTASMVAAVEAADAVADLVVVSIHWGVELDTEPRPEDVERARAMISAGADVIFGHHAHRLQPHEMMEGAAVFWGLGNFVWPRFSTAGSTTAVARVVVAPEGDIEMCLIPAFIETSGQPVLTGEPPCGPVR